MLDIVFHNTTKDTRYDEVYFTNILEIAIGELEMQERIIELSVNLVDSTKMQELNKQYRHKDKPTDVLSFPLQNLDNPISNKTKVDGIISLGDIFISLSVAEQKAHESGKTLDQEVSFLTVHGFLHLLGYDHERSVTDEKVMFDLQDKILNKLI